MLRKRLWLQYRFVLETGNTWMALNGIMKRMGELHVLTILIPSTAYRLQIKEIEILCQNRSEHYMLTKSLCACVCLSLSLYIYIYMYICSERQTGREPTEKQATRQRETTNPSTFELLSGFFVRNDKPLLSFSDFFFRHNNCTKKKCFVIRSFLQNLNLGAISSIRLKFFHKMPSRYYVILHMSRG